MNAGQDAVAAVCAALDHAASAGLHGAIQMRHPDGTLYTLVPAPDHPRWPRLLSRAASLASGIPPFMVVVWFPGQDGTVIFDLRPGGRAERRYYTGAKGWRDYFPDTAPPSPADLMGLAARIRESEITGIATPPGR